MAESFQEKTHAATPRKRSEAFKKGQVPRSQEVTNAFLLLAAASVLQVGGPHLASTLAALFGSTMAQATAPPVGAISTAEWIGELGWRTLGGIAPILVAMAGVALMVGAVQGRGVLTVEPLKPDWSKLNPQKTIQRIWGVRAVAELAKSLLKLTIVGVAVYLALRSASADLSGLAQQSPYALLQIIRKYAVRLLVIAGLAYLLLAMADYAYQLWQHEKGLRMSMEEIKREQKDSDGDPNVKARVRSMGRSLARRRMLISVSDADVVITNPTHVAVALKYDPSLAAAPIVLAMGERKVAEKIKEIALEAGVPLVENKPLARALLAAARIGLPIPVELYVAVAEVLAFVIRQRANWRPAWRGNSVV